MEAGTYENGYEYVRLRENKDEKVLVIPGLNDEMIRSTDYPLVLKYHFRGMKDYQVVVASRKRGLDSDITTEEMAEDYKDIVKEEGKCHVLGISMGGMIAQHLVRKTGKVDKLVLGFSSEKLGTRGVEAIEKWVDMLERDEVGRFYSEVVKDTFTGLQRSFLRLPASTVGKKASSPPKSDLIACSKACLKHDTSSEISDIENDTMFIGGTEDQFFPRDVIESAASKMDAETKYMEGGHSSFYQHSSKFHDKAQKFLKTR